MPITPLPSPSPQDLFRRAFSRIKLRPKLKKTDPHITPENAISQISEAPLLKRRQMGFKEWCEKVYEPSCAASTRQEIDR